MNRSVPHGGNVYRVAKRLGRSIDSFVDFSASINPWGPPTSVLGAMRLALTGCARYPDPHSEELCERLAKEHGVPQGSILLGNGSAELIRLLPKALGVRHGYVVGPTFMEFEHSLRVAGASCTYVHAESARKYDPPLDTLLQFVNQKGVSSQAKPSRMSAISNAVFFCHPNSPTGRGVSFARVRELVRQTEREGWWLVIDEAFMDFWPSHSMVSWVNNCERVLVLRSFTKFFGIPGLRLGYIVGSVPVIQNLHPYLPPWSINHIAQRAGVAAIEDSAFRRRSLRLLERDRASFMSQLQRISGIRVIPPKANFVMVELPKECSAEALISRLEQQGVLVRNCATFSGMTTPAIRLAVRRSHENSRLVRLLKRALQDQLETNSVQGGKQPRMAKLPR